MYYMKNITKRFKGFALIDVIIAIILVGAISISAVNYVYRQADLQLAGQNTVTAAQELMALLYVCMQETAHNSITAQGDSYQLTCADVGACVDNHVNGLNGATQWELPAGASVTVSLGIPTQYDAAFILDLPGIDAAQIDPILCIAPLSAIPTPP